MGVHRIAALARLVEVVSRRERLPAQPKDHLFKREFFVDNLLVRIHLIIKMVSVDRPCAMGV